MTGAPGTIGCTEIIYLFEGNYLAIDAVLCDKITTIFHLM
jgi:hypothetical protein